MTENNMTENNGVTFEETPETTNEIFFYGFDDPQKGGVELEVKQSAAGTWTVTADYYAEPADTWLLDSFQEARELCDDLAREAGAKLYTMSGDEENDGTGIVETLMRETKLTAKEREKYLSNGTAFYTNDTAGFEEYRGECIAGLWDEEDIPEAWEELAIVGGYRVDWVL